MGNLQSLQTDKDSSTYVSMAKNINLQPLLGMYFTEKLLDVSVVLQVQ
jgi:hypothetical protein